MSGAVALRPAPRLAGPMRAVALPVALLVLWQLWAMAQPADTRAPSPARVVATFAQLTASGDLPRQVDALQAELREGPCLDAAERQEAYLVPDLREDARWPVFGPQVVRDLDVRSMVSSRSTSTRPAWARSTPTPRRRVPSTTRRSPRWASWPRTRARASRW